MRTFAAAGRFSKTLENNRISYRRKSCRDPKVTRFEKGTKIKPEIQFC